MAKDRIDDNAGIDNMEEKDLDQYGVWVSPEGQDTNDGNNLSSDLLDIEEDLGSNDLGDLNDLLLSIDEENDNDETIYLEEDDMSLDLDSEADTLIHEQGDNRSSPAEPDDIGDFQIPSLDGEELTLSLDDDEELVIPEMQAPEEDSLGDLGRGLNDLSMEEHDMDDSLPPPPEDDFLDITLDEQNSTTDLLSVETEDDTSDLVLDAIDESGSDELLDDLGEDMAFDLPEDDTILLDNTPFEGDEIILDDSQDLDIGELTGSSSPMDLPEDGFDDVAALQDDLFDSPAHAIELSEELVQEPVEVAAPRNTIKAAEPSISESASSVLTSIEKELLAIRSELTDLRSELKRLRSRDSAIESSGSMDSDPFDEPLAEPVDDIINEDADLSVGFESTATDSPKGFFEDDEDETIALTGDELDNILNSAEFTEEAGQPTVVEEAEHLARPEPIEIILEPESVLQENDLMNQVTFEDDTNTEVAPIEEITLEEIATDENQFNPDEILLDDLSMEPDSKEGIFEGDDTEVESMANLDIEKELAGIEDLSDGSSDLELFTDDSLADMELDIQDLHSNTSTEDIDPAIEEISLDNELAPPEEAPPRKPIEPKPAIKSSAESLTGAVPYNIKQEIKAVLQYMDQLLDALPQEKIADFAKSEHFETYKKLFEELGI
jgi:hypothetical protein